MRDTLLRDTPSTSGVTRPWLIATGLWFFCVGAFTWLNMHLGRQDTICLLKNLTDIPCPGCGGTRAVLSLAKGELATAFSFNPMASAALFLSPLICFAWIRNQKRAPDERWRPGRTSLTILLLLVAANWIYLVKYLP